VAKPQAVLFDVDGTLISTGGAGARSWRYAFDELHGIPADIGQYTDAGWTDPEVAKRTFLGAVGHEPSPQELATVMAAYLDRLPWEVEHSEKYRVLDGAEETLRTFSRDGVLLGVTSGAVEAAAHIKLSRAGFNRYFPFGGYGSDSADRIELTRCALARGGRLVGHELDPKKCFVVGDTPKDIDAGHGAGCLAIGTATGHYDADQLRDAGADHVMTSLREPFPEV